MLSEPVATAELYQPSASPTSAASPTGDEPTAAANPTPALSMERETGLEPATFSLEGLMV